MGILNELLTQIQPALTTLLVAVAIALLGVLTTAVVVLQGRITTWLGERFADRRWAAAIGKIDEATTAAVAAVEQSVVQDLRAIEPVGKLSDEQARAALKHAVAAAKLHFAPAAWTEIGETLGLEAAKLEELAKTRIEAAVHAMKEREKELPILESTIVGRVIP